ncbi:hypothetical protein EJ06DRAFT_242395 [Trichodelitschia bisporula]|uniref:Uncharacterized protein n=1 Tax=Trichodelitschia bisporula TaxID=703511 RepID=A0A6G1HJ96_9PEZI|nr:hypothetical protein EJ06DRAFT_242395 [Trichodelitschia bisporula]
MAKFTWDSNTVTAFAAVLLAAAAFIVAFLQVILEYMSSSTTRNLCSPQAIGVSAHQTKYSWNFGSWKLRVFYPLIKMDTGTLLLLFMSSEQRSISRVPELRRIAKAHDWRWRAIESSESIDRNTIADDLTCMIARGRNGKSGGLITAKDLDWNEWFVFQWYRFRHPLRKFGRPRSSWAQLITALGIRDTRSLTIEVVDAETVPASMDTPIQRVKLRQIGVLAFILGFQSVELDIPNRFFRALSPFGTITTQLNNVLGKVLRFEGDLVAFRSLISRCEAEWVFRGRDLIHGQQSFGKYLTSATYYPLYTLHRAMVDNLPTGVYDDEERADIIAAGRGYSTGPAYLEATIMRRFLMRILEKQEVQLHSLKRRMTDQVRAPRLQSTDAADSAGNGPTGAAHPLVRYA